MSLFLSENERTNERDTELFNLKRFYAISGKSNGRSLRLLGNEFFCLWVSWIGCPDAVTFADKWSLVCRSKEADANSIRDGHQSWPGVYSVEALRQSEEFRRLSKLFSLDYV